MIDSEGRPTPRAELAEAEELFRSTEEDWQRERDAMLAVCVSCHPDELARSELEKGDAIIRESDRILAGAIRLVRNSRREPSVEEPRGSAEPYPDLLSPEDAPEPIEQELAKMFFEHRMRAFQESFHGSHSDGGQADGLAAMRRTLADMEELARELRETR
jgi:hypothetical protein